MWATAKGSTFTPCISGAGRAQTGRARSARSAPKAVLDALLFDCDGVLADTERDAHRVAFNLAFSEYATLSGVSWSEQEYGQLLETGGGKERLNTYLETTGWPSVYTSRQELRDSLVQRLHARKTELFMQLVDAGKVPLRAGVQRLVHEALQQGVQIAVCSTSNEKAVARIVAMLGTHAEKHIEIFAGDMVQNKKPSPDIYNMAKHRLQLDASKVCVIEDSFIGVQAARAAGMPVVVTKSTYTENEDFSQAHLVLNSLDDPVTSLPQLSALVASLA